MTTRVVVHPANHAYKVTVKEGDQTHEIEIGADVKTPFVAHIWFGKSLLIEEIATDAEKWVPDAVETNT